MHNVTCHKLLQAKVVTKPLKYTDACVHPNAKRLTLPGATGPVNAVDVDGTLFIENDAAEAAAEALCSKALQLASEVAPAASEGAPAASEIAPAASEVAPAASEGAPAASEVAPAASEVALAPKPTPKPAEALDSEPSCSVVTSSAADSITYSAAASKPAVGPKPSVAACQLRSAASSKFTAGLKRSAPASQPAVVLTPLEVNICACTHLQCSAHYIYYIYYICDAVHITSAMQLQCTIVHITSLMCSARYISDAVHINAVHIISAMQCTDNVYCADQEVDDFAVAQSTPLPECIAGFEGDTVRRLSDSLPTFFRYRLMLSQSPAPKPSPL
jgi:hypothetical protein